MKPSDAFEHKVVRESQRPGASQETDRSSASWLALLLCQQQASSTDPGTVNDREGPRSTDQHDLVIELIAWKVFSGFST